MVATSTYRTLLDRDIAHLEQKLAELDELYARWRAELVERIERLEKIREVVDGETIVRQTDRR